MAADRHQMLFPKTIHFILAHFQGTSYLTIKTNNAEAMVWGHTIKRSQQFY